MEASAQTDQHADQSDWLAGATVEFGGEIEEQADVPLDGLDFGADDETSVA
jgi:hypothetical protein